MQSLPSDHRVLLPSKCKFLANMCYPCRDIHKYSLVVSRTRLSYLIISVIAENCFVISKSRYTISSMWHEESAFSSKGKPQQFEKETFFGRRPQSFELSQTLLLVMNTNFDLSFELLLVEKILCCFSNSEPVMES